MQHGTYNRTPFKAIALSVALCLGGTTLFAAAPNTRPATVSEIAQLSSFKMVMLSIANLNRAMRSAAMNPQDDSRRLDVQNAVRAMPPAIILLAKDFKAGKLGNEDLPLVQKLLGGFVDQAAPDKYKQFMKKPDASLIPAINPQLAGMLPAPSAPSAAPQVAGAAPRSGSAGQGGGFEKAEASAPANPQILSLADPALMAQAPSSTGTDKAGASASLVYDEGAAKQQASTSSGNLANTTSASAEASAAASESRGNRAPASASNSTLTYSGGGAQSTREAMSDLGKLEVQLAGTPAKDSDRTEFFNQSKVGSEEEAADESGANHRKGKKLGKRPRASLTPKFWRAHALIYFAESLLIRNASAEQGGKEGGDAAEMLFGIAQIIGAMAPIAVASIQAGADKYIAKTNADAAISMTQITSDTSRYLADQQKDIALKQADIAQSVSKQNNDYVSQRLNLQLSELRDARHEAQQAEREKRAIEQYYNQQRIDLAREQEKENVKLAQQTLQAQLTQLGLSNGSATSINSADRLTVDRGFGGATSSAAAGQGGGAGLGARGASAQTSVPAGVNSESRQAARAATEEITGKPSMATAMTGLPSRGLAATGETVTTAANAPRGIMDDGFSASGAPRATRSAKGRALAETVGGGAGEVNSFTADLAASGDPGALAALAAGGPRDAANGELKDATAGMGEIGGAPVLEQGSTASAAPTAGASKDGKSDAVFASVGASPAVATNAKRGATRGRLAGNTNVKSVRGVVAGGPLLDYLRKQNPAARGSWPGQKVRVALTSPNGKTDLADFGARPKGGESFAAFQRDQGARALEQLERNQTGARALRAAAQGRGGNNAARGAYNSPASSGHKNESNDD